MLHHNDAENFSFPSRQTKKFCSEKKYVELVRNKTLLFVKIGS
jgi:hypothetical protein